MEQDKTAPTTAPSLPGDDLLRDFERHEDAALAAARARVEELEKRARQTFEQHPERLRQQLGELQRRIQTGQAECDRAVEMLRATLAGGRMKQEEFRAHLVNLEMEYAARCRTAEHGAQLMSEELRSFLNTAAAEVSNLCERVRETLDAQRAYRPRLNEILHLHDARARRSEERVGHALSLLHRVHHKLQTLLAERSASRSTGEESRKALSELEAKLRALADEAASQRSQLGLMPLTASPETPPPTVNTPAAADPVANAPADAEPRVAAAEERAAAAEAHASKLAADIAALQGKLSETDTRASDLEILSARTLAALAETRRDADLAKDALGRSAETQDDERDRALESLREVIAERDAARAQLKTAQQAAAEVARLRERLASSESARKAEGESAAAAQQPPPQEKLIERLDEAMAARDIAKEHAQQADQGLAALLVKVAELEGQLKDRPAEPQGAAPEPRVAAVEFRVTAAEARPTEDIFADAAPTDLKLTEAQPPQTKEQDPKPPEAKPREEATVLWVKPPELTLAEPKAVEVKAPEPRVAAPEPRVAAPEPRVAAPEPRVAAPEASPPAPTPEPEAPANPETPAKVKRAVPRWPT